MDEGDLLRGMEMLPHPFLRRARDVVVLQGACFVLIGWIVWQEPSLAGILCVLLAASFWIAYLPQSACVLRTLQSVRDLRGGVRVVTAEVTRHELVRTTGPTLWRVAVSFEGAAAVADFPPAAGWPSFSGASRERITALVGSGGRLVPISERGYPAFLPAAVLARIGVAARRLPRGPEAHPSTNVPPPRVRDALELRCSRITALCLLGCAAWGAFDGLGSDAWAILAAGAVLMLGYVRWRSRWRSWFVRADGQGIHVTGKRGDRTFPWESLARLVVTGGSARAALCPEEVATEVSFAEDVIARRFAWAGIRGCSRCRLVLVSAGGRRDESLAPVDVETAAWVAAEALARGIDLEVTG